LALAAAPVKNPAGDVVGVMFAEKRIDNSVLQQINFGQSDTQLSVLYQNRILATTAANPVNVAALPGSSAVQQATNGQGWISADYFRDSTGRLGTLAYVPIQIGRNAEAIAIVQLDLGNLFAFQQTVLASTLFVFTALALGTLVFIILFMRAGIVAPLSRLTAVT